MTGRARCSRETDGRDTLSSRSSRFTQGSGSSRFTRGSASARFTRGSASWGAAIKSRLSCARRGSFEAHAPVVAPGSREHWLATQYGGRVQSGGTAASQADELGGSWQNPARLAAQKSSLNASKLVTSFKQQSSGSLRVENEWEKAHQSWRGRSTDSRRGAGASQGASDTSSRSGTSHSPQMKIERL